MLILCYCGENSLGPFQHKFQNEASSKTKMDAIVNFQFETILGQKTAYLWRNTTLYSLYKWIKTVCMLGYLQIYDIMLRNATICP